jgi:predicted patatin/cPLA2 family phospholipase
MLFTVVFFLWVLFSSSHVLSLNQLSFSGGGSLGAVEIGIIKKLSERGLKKFDLYTGISAGALNAGLLSYFSKIDNGINVAENIYSNLRNRMVYKLLPTTDLSLLNTEPLFNTLSDIINKMPNEPVIHTLLGATNLYSGNLDVYAFEDNSNLNKVNLMMASSAIPGLFPPIKYNGKLYADGGTLSNELLQVEHNKSQYINITYITPYEGYIYDDTPITSLKEVIKKTIMIVTSNFNNPLSTINQNCRTPIGEINKYFVKPEYLKGYNILDFDNGAKLIDIGYNHVEHIKYKLC